MTSPTDRVLDLARHLVEDTGLVWVPGLVRLLVESSHLTPGQATAAVLSAGQAGLIELRPESGLGRLTEAELALCPTTTDYLTGGRLALSWARVS